MAVSALTLRAALLATAAMLQPSFELTHSPILHRNTGPTARRPAAAVRMAGTPQVPFKVPNSDYFQWVSIYERMARERILFLNQPLNDNVVNSVIATMLYLENQDRTSPVQLYVNVPGSLTKSGLALLDTMQTIAFPVSTLNLGIAAQGGALICAAGTKGQRLALPNARFILADPWSIPPPDGNVPIMQAEDMYREAVELLRDRDRMADTVARLTGLDKGEVRKNMKRAWYLDAKDAVAVGLIDRIVEPKTPPRASEWTGKEKGFGVA